MKLAVDKIESLINKSGNSKSGFAKIIGLTHTGLISGLKNSTLKIKSLIKIAEYFNKPIEYFFDEKLSNEEKSSIINHDPTSPYIKKCENPDCIKIVKEKDRIINDLRLTNDLLKEKLEEKGEIEPGKKVKGGVEKPREAG